MSQSSNSQAKPPTNYIISPCSGKQIQKIYELVVEPPLSKICSSKWEASPNRGDNKKYLKPPPRSIMKSVTSQHKNYFPWHIPHPRSGLKVTGDDDQPKCTPTKKIIIHPQSWFSGKMGALRSASLKLWEKEISKESKSTFGSGNSQSKHYQWRTWLDLHSLSLKNWLDQGIVGCTPTNVPLNEIPKKGLL